MQHLQTSSKAPSMLFARHKCVHQRAHSHVVVLAKQRKQPEGRPTVGPSRIQPRTPSPPAAASATEPATSFRIIIQGRNVSVTPAIKQHLESKLISAVSSFEAVIREVWRLSWWRPFHAYPQQYLTHQMDVKVKVHGGDATKGPRDQVTEVTVYTFRNGVVRVVERAESLYASIDLVADKLTRSLRKLKEKALPKGKWPGHHATVKGGAVITEVLDASATVDELPTAGSKAALPAEIVKTKHFHLEPLDVDEAIEQLQFMSHDFFLFQDKATGTVQVLYRRHAGGYGIIVPEVGGPK